VQRLLLNRRDIFGDYIEERFRQVFSSSFTIIDRQPIPASDRTLYLMRSRQHRA
jgi:hypothetical protein